MSLLWLLAGSMPAAAQNGGAVPVTEALRVAGRAGIILDGVLNEPIWASVSVMTGFRQREPVEGDPASERTEVRIVYDSTTLYVGVSAFDSDPAGVIARILQRDAVMSPGFFGDMTFAGDDGVALLFDTFHDHRNGVVFATNPNGAEFDALLTDEGRELNVDWRGVWEVSSARSAEGWSAEFAIPFRTLRFQDGPEGSEWGLNIFRIIRRKNEEVLWSAWSRQNEGFHRVSRAGHLQGLRDLPRPGINLEVKPYALGGATQLRRDGVPGLDAEPQYDVGVDAKWEVRPGLLLDLTANTDFAQIEADDQQVNLTRFSLFFPEKRDFFLENSGIFEYGERGFFEPPPFMLFFSRQIGISDAGEVPVLGGARLTGRAGGQTVGLLNVVTDEAFGTSRTNFAVARVKRDVGGNNYIGAIVTDRRSAQAWNTTGGADFSYWPTSRLNLRGFLAGTSTQGEGGEGSAVRINADYTSDRFGFNLGHLAISPDAQADMGFITRTDIHRSDAFFRVTPRPAAIGLRRVDLRWFSGLVTRIDGALQDWSFGPSINPQWNSGENISLDYTRGFTRLDEGFDIGPDVSVPLGDYHWWSVSLSGGTSANRPVSVNTSADYRSIYDGDITSASGTVRAVPNANVATSFSYRHNRVDIPSGAFNADVASLRLSYAFSTKLSANALIQYNSLADRFSANIRVNFIHRPGSDLFVVLNEERDTGSPSWRVLNRTSVVKLTYLARI